jgi:hypothetical protein
MMNDFLTVQTSGFVTYCDALIARISDGPAQSLLFSLIGSPTQVQAASAHFYNGGLCRISGTENGGFDLSRGSGTIHSLRTRKIGDTVNKIMISTDHFPGTAGEAPVASNGAVIFGPDLDSVKERAFLRLNGCTTMPLKPQWREWLWDEVLLPEKLFSFGNRELQEAWSIGWQDEQLEELVLTGIRQNYLN